MKVTRASDYAIRSLIHMAKKPIGTTFMRSELSKECEVPDSFLGKILQNLAKSDMLVSERGKKGGFRLNKEPETVSVYDIICAIEGELSLNECLFDSEFCDFSSTCSAHSMWHKIQEKFVNDLKDYSLKTLAEEDKR